MKKYDAILFDLDGTLLPMKLDEFTGAYFGALCNYMKPYGFQPKPIVESLWAGVRAMVKNDGTVPNMDRFWQLFSEQLGTEVLNYRGEIDNFYRNEFNQAQSATQPNPLAYDAVRIAREKTGRVVLATNPLFPADGVATRLGWIGLAPENFDYVTTYENSHYCKPNPMYYTELVEKLGLLPESCLMIGNDLAEDGAAAKAGLDVHIVTDCLIEGDADVSAYSSGTFAELISYLGDL